MCVLVWFAYFVLLSSTSFSLDGSSSAVDISPWGEMSNYLLYGSLFALPMFLVIVGYCFYLEPFYFNEYGTNRTDSKHVFLKYALTAGHLLYLPTCLAVFRLYYCNPTTDKLGCDPSVMCGSNQHIIALAAGTVFMLPLAVGLPIVTYKYIKQSVIYRIPVDHEKRLQIWEVSFMLGIDNKFVERQLWLTSSFNLSHVYFRFEMLLTKLAALCIFIFARADFGVQGALFWLLFAQFSVRYVSAYPYRSFSTNIMIKVLCALLLADVTFGLMNATGAQSAMLVASVETVWLLGINGIGALLLLAVVIVSILNPYATAPADTTLRGINDNASNAMIKVYSRWVCLLHNYHRFRNNWYAGTRLNADIIGMEQLIQVLRRHWLIARSKGSLFETLLTEALEDLLIMKSFTPKGSGNEYSAGSGAPVGANLRRRECWNMALEESSGEQRAHLLTGVDGTVRNNFLSPLPYNSSNSRVFAKTAKRRSDMYVLMNPKKKRLMQKLLAVRALMGNRDLAHFDRKGLSTEEAEHNWILNEKMVRKKHEDAVLSAHDRIPELVSESNAALSAAKEQLGQSEGILTKLEGRDSLSADEIQDFNTILKAHAADLEQQQLVLLDLIAEWDETIDTYESKDVQSVGTRAAIAAKDAAMRAESVLARHGKVAYTSEEQEEWYTYRMVLNNKLMLINEAAQSAIEGLLEEDFQIQIPDGGLEVIWSGNDDEDGGMRREAGSELAELEGLMADAAGNPAADIVLPDQGSLRRPPGSSPLVSKLDISSLLHKDSMQYSGAAMEANMDMELDALDVLHDAAQEDMEAGWGDAEEEQDGRSIGGGGSGDGHGGGGAVPTVADLGGDGVESVSGRMEGDGDVGNWGEQDDEE